MIKLFKAAIFSRHSADLMAQDFNKGMKAYQAGHYETAVHEWRQLAARGYAPAEYNLGVMYRQGEGVIQDSAEAANWLRLAAEEGHVGAQYILGIMHENGEGVIQDNTEAANWFRKAAEQGDVEAQYNLV
jgi:TPR repeat protein